MKIIVGFSGGIDSAMAAHFLREKGHDVFPVTLVLTEETGEETIRRARDTADLMGLRKPVVLDAADSFKKLVIETFLAFYRRGLTPNPCVFCNERVKIRGLFQMAGRLGCEKVATGHYARILACKGRKSLMCGVDHKKDQSYMLYRVAASLYPAILFPLGRWTKEEIRRRARLLYPSLEGMTVESHDLCFLAHGELPSFLERNVNDEPGKIRTTGGDLLGTHKGLSRYTIGQRQGLGLSGGPWFVITKETASGTLVVGRRSDLAVDEIECTDIVLHEKLFPGQIVSMRHRYRSSSVDGTIAGFSGGKIRLRCLEPAFGVAPGQSMVLYSGERTLGGGIIEKTCWRRPSHEARTTPA